jgi:glutaminyl-tRNA synthetase
LEFCVREDLNKITKRVMGVLNPVKLVITNYPDDKEEQLTTENNPEDKDAGTREIPFSKELYIEREDFKEDVGNKFFRLTIGNEVRLKSAYIIKGQDAVKDSDGNITEIHCTYDPDSLSGSGSEASLRKVKGTLHWVSAKHAFEAEVREYDRLFSHEAPDGDKEKSFMDYVNPNSLKLITAYLEPSLKNAKVGDRFQFQRLGYFCVDPDSTSEKKIFNKTVGLRDTWAKQKPKQENNKPAQQAPARPAIEEVKKLGKKYTNLPAEKQVVAKQKIQELAVNVSYDELEPLFNTAVKKSGTRIAVAIALGVLLANGQEKTSTVIDFISKAKEDSNDLLVLEAKAL